jgi:hypothetical protein
MVRSIDITVGLDVLFPKETHFFNFERLETLKRERRFERGAGWVVEI